MSLDKSLKKAGSLAQGANVLTRAERLALLQEDDRWSPRRGCSTCPRRSTAVWRQVNPARSGRRRAVEFNRPGWR